jgi:hypothetical protein
MEKKATETTKKKLVLKKQALRNLTDLQLDAIAGGMLVASEPHGMPSTDAI